MEQQKPSVGRTVHYVAFGTPGGEFPAGVCRAAIITEVYGPGNMPPGDTVLEIDEHGHCTTVGLCVLNPTGQYFSRHVRYAEPDIVHGKVVHNPGTWHWPERV